MCRTGDTARPSPPPAPAAWLRLRSRSSWKSMEAKNDLASADPQRDEKKTITWTALDPWRKGSALTGFRRITEVILRRSLHAHYSGSGRLTHEEPDCCFICHSIDS